MSTSLYWSKIPVEPHGEPLGSLKYDLCRRLWGDDSDGSCPEPAVVVDEKLIPFLEGIMVGNGGGDMGRDARRLIEVLRKYGKIHLSIY